MLRRRVPVQLCALALSFTCAASAQTGQESLQTLQQQIDRGHVTEALDRLGVLAAQKPVPAGVYRLQGKAFYGEDRFADADTAFAAALAQDPKDLESTQMRGLTLFRLGKPGEAIPFLTAAHEWGPGTRVDPSYVLALCYIDARRYDDARHAFAAQYGFPPDSAAAYLLAARMLLRREFLPVAQTFASKALELDPHLPLAHALLGEIALAGNHLDVAVAEFEQERTHNPLDGAVYDRLGDAYSRAGDYQKALQSLQQAVVLEPTVTAPYILLGKVLLKQEAPANAAMYLERAESMDPGNSMTHSLLGQAYRSLGRPADSTREMQMVQKIQAESGPKLQNIK